VSFFGNLIDWFKLSPSRFFAITVITAVLLFAPPTFLETLGVSTFVSQYRPILGVICLISGVLFFVHPISQIATALSDIGTDKLAARTNRKWLRTLTKDEKAILCRYVTQGTQSQMLDPESGITNGLVAKGIIYRAANIGRLGYGFAYNIQPWAWDYLNDHPELLGQC